VKVGSKEYVLGLWDTAGSERFESMSRLYYRNANAALICYGNFYYYYKLKCLLIFLLDITNSLSFSKAKRWVEELETSESDCINYLVATKCDLIFEESAARAVSMEDVEEFAKLYNLKPFETSSKTGFFIIL
jgi:Ras-related protein Rab-24